MNSSYAVDEVCADKESGEWLTQPVQVHAAINRKVWHGMQDTEDTHYDTYEVDEVTRGIKIVWQ